MESYFSKIYLRSGYYQLTVRGENIPKMTFQTRYGHYEFPLMSFGLINSLTFFINLMNKVFRGYLYSFVIFVLDIILVYLKNMGEHMDYLRVVLQVLKEN